MAVITLKGTPTHTIGELPAVGQAAPEFTLTKMDMSEIKLKNYLGRRILLNIFPSLDTETCASAMHRYNEIASLVDNILILCISADLPFAQKRFCVAEHLDNLQPASIFRHPEFGIDYGVTITDGPLAGLLSRAVVLIDEAGNVVYTQQVSEISAEPNYQAIMDVLSKHTKE